jgi:CRP-like cAMP-binding protein
MALTPPDCEQCKTRSQSLFHFCHLDELKGISDAKACTVYKRGQIIFEEGTRPSGLYCINHGKVKIYKYASDGREQIIRIAKPGDFLGYSSLLSDEIYRASAAALEDCTVCIVPRSEIDSLFRDNQSFSQGFMKLLCSTIDESMEKMADLAYKPVRGRIAEALLLLRNSYIDEENPEGIISLTREDLASLVGTVKETAIRTLKEFREDNLIRTDKREIHVLDPKGLIRISQIYD